jgi:hypothetical protein
MISYDNFLLQKYLRIDSLEASLNRIAKVCSCLKRHHGANPATSEFTTTTAAL